MYTSWKILVITSMKTLVELIWFRAWLLDEMKQLRGDGYYGVIKYDRTVTNKREEAARKVFSVLGYSDLFSYQTLWLPGGGQATR